MGRFLHGVERLQAPLVRVDECIVDIPADGEVFVTEVQQEYKVLFFLEADHDLHVDGFPVMPIRSGDVLVQPLSVTQTYRARRAKTASRIHVLRIFLRLPLIRPGQGGEKPAAGKRLRDSEWSLQSFVLKSFDRLCHLSRPLSPHLLEQVAILRSESESKQMGYRFRVSALCTELLVEIAREIHHPPAAVNPSLPQKAPVMVQRVKEFLIENYGRNLTLEEIAWEVRLSREHLARIFRECTGQTVFEWLTQLRVEMAQSQLYDPNLLVHEVAARCGFSSATLFGRKFRQIVGVTPMEYRRRQVGGMWFEPSKRSRSNRS